MKTLRLLSAVLLLAGCTAPDPDARAAADSVAPPPAAAEEPAVPPPPAPDRPETKQVELDVEGMGEAMTLRLYRSPSGFALPFSTYVPADVQPEAARSEDGDAMRFVSAFGGTRDERAQLRLVVLPAGSDGERAWQLARAAAERRGGTPLERPQYPWAHASYRLQGEADGFLSLGEHAGRWFYLVMEYPPDYAEGFTPRALVILREWRWAGGDDTGPGG